MKLQYTHVQCTHERNGEIEETQMRNIIGGKSHVDMVNEQTDYDMVCIAVKMLHSQCLLFMCSSNYVIKMTEKTCI